MKIEIKSTDGYIVLSLEVDPSNALVKVGVHTDQTEIVKADAFEVLLIELIAALQTLVRMK